jgi:hypothetical protein
MAMDFLRRYFGAEKEFAEIKPDSAYAEQLLNNPVWRDVCNLIRVELHRTWASTKLEDEATREEIFRQLKMVSKIEGYIEHFAIAQDEDALRAELNKQVA